MSLKHLTEAPKNLMEASWGLINKASRYVVEALFVCLIKNV